LKEKSNVKAVEWKSHKQGFKRSSHPKKRDVIIFVSLLISLGVRRGEGKKTRLLSLGTKRNLLKEFWSISQG
jgi:hypothetical protein